MKSEHHGTPPEGHTGDSGDSGDSEVPALSRRPRRRFSPRAAVVAVVAVTALAVGGGAAYAASDQDGPSTETTCPPVMAPGGVDGGVDSGPGAVGFARPLHGEFVVATDSGTETQLMQTGEVTALTDASVTVVSSDDYTKEYTVDTSTLVGPGGQSLSDLATGDTVTVLAGTPDDTATAIFVDDPKTVLPPPGSPDGPHPPWPGPSWHGCIAPQAS
jgi:hypothetical protein